MEFALDTPAQFAMRQEDASSTLTAISSSSIVSFPLLLGYLDRSIRSVVAACLSPVSSRRRYRTVAVATEYW